MFVNQEHFTNPFTTKTRAQFSHSSPLTKEQGGLFNRFPGLQLPHCLLKFTFRKVNHWQASDSKREAKSHFVPMPWLIKKAQENGNFILTIFVMFITTSTTTMNLCVCEYVCCIHVCKGSMAQNTCGRQRHLCGDDSLLPCLCGFQ